MAADRLRVGLLIPLALAAGVAVGVSVGGSRDGGAGVSFLNGEVRFVSIDGDSLCLAKDARAKEVCAPPALKAGQRLPKVGDRVYVARATVRSSDDDSSRTFVYVFPALPGNAP